MHTIKTANENDRSSAPVNRPHTPNEILQTNKCYRHYDYSGCWNLRKFHVIFTRSNKTKHNSYLFLWLITFLLR